MKLEFAAPASVGIPASALTALLETLNEKNCGNHSLMIARHGKVVLSCRWDPYRLEDVHMLYSLSKSFTSTAVGFAVTEGRLRLSDTVVSFFPEKLPPRVSPRLRAMTVENLLTMSAGHDPDPTRPVFQSEDWIGTFFAQPLPTQPGTHFVYNTAATFMLSAIVQKITGEKLIDYLRPRLFLPLGFNLEGVYWDESPEGICVGGSGLHIHTEDILRFGLCLLQKGVFEGKQVIPREWVELATAKHVSNGDPATLSDWNQGYGYQFWRCVPEGVFRGDGAFSQNCIVCTKEDIVIASNGGTNDLQTPLRAFWDFLKQVDTVSPTEAADQALLDSLSDTLQCPTQPCANRCPCPNKHPEAAGSYAAGENPYGITGLEAAFTNCDGTLTLCTAEGTFPLACGPRRWKPALLPTPHGSWEVYASGAWNTDGHFVTKLLRKGFPDVVTLTLAPEAGTLTVSAPVGGSPGCEIALTRK